MFFLYESRELGIAVWSKITVTDKRDADVLIVRVIQVRYVL